MSLRIVKMGTGTFALPTFLELCNSSHRVVGLFTQPDRTGRGHHHHPHPMKEAALERDIPVFQPPSVRTDEALNDLRALQPDLCVVAAYGQILPAELLAIPRFGAINLHASLLPKYRGAAPIQYAIRYGETETGVTVFQIEPKLDAGLILGVTATEIGSKETSGELQSRLATLAVPLTMDIVNQIESGTTSPVAQDPSLVTKAPRLNKSEGEIDWSRSRREIDCHIRAMQPWPKPFTWLCAEGREPLRAVVLDVDAVDVDDTNSPPGTVIADDHRLLVACGDGVLQIATIQPAGKRAMTAAQFMNGHQSAGGVFGSPDQLTSSSG